MVAALTANYQAALKRTRLAVGDAIGQEWRRLGSYDESDVPRFVERVTPIVHAGQSRAVALSAAYVARKLGQTPPGVTLNDLNLRNGVPPATVYRRPFVRMWTSLKNEGDYGYAVQLGQDQSESNGLMDVALATMAAYVAFSLFSSSGNDAGTDSEIIGWTRVADPGCCDFCASIDGAHTGPAEPQPLHNRCGCTADPIIRAFPRTGVRLEPGVSEGDATIHLHGELGPVIGQKGDHFTGPSEIPAGDL